MGGRALRCALAAAAACLVGAADARAAIIGPPWCGTPAPDAAENLPSTGTGAFPHVPTYAIGCTLEKIQAASNGRMKIEIAGRSVQDRPLYLVTIDARETPEQRLASDNYAAVHSIALSDPVAAI